MVNANTMYKFQVQLFYSHIKRHKGTVLSLPSEIARYSINCSCLRYTVKQYFNTHGTFICSTTTGVPIKGHDLSFLIVSILYIVFVEGIILSIIYRMS